DELRGPGNTIFPFPWAGSPGVIYEGCAGCTYDSGAVRIVNNSNADVVINSVVVRLDTCAFNIWPHNVVLPAGEQLILAQTVPGAGNGCTADGEFDTSDVGPNGAAWASHCNQSGVIPTVDVTVGGVKTTYVDTQQVLNTKGIDAATCG